MRVPLTVIAREWGRIGCVGFGGPPAHIALLRELCVERRGWIAAADFEDAIAAVNLLPGPASTQLSVYCAYRVGGRRGACRRPPTTASVARVGPAGIGSKMHTTAGRAGSIQVSGRMYGNSSTSRIEAESVNSMTSRSIPTPSPPVGGRPVSSARM